MWPGKLASPSWPAAPGPAWRGRQSAGLSSWIVPATLTRSPGSPPPGAPPRGGPGVVGAALNAAARPHGLMFGPDPASADRATFGGMIATNATGAHSIRYGMTADHLLEAEVVLSDGSTARLGPVGEEAARHKAEASTLEGRIYRRALDVRASAADQVRQDWPRAWRRGRPVPADVIHRLLSP